MKNRFQEALDLIKLQLMKTDQNLKAFETLQELVDLVSVMDELEDGTLKTYTLEEAMEQIELGALGTEGRHLKNFFDKSEELLKEYDEAYRELANNLPEYVLNDWDDDPKIDK
jgi:hypothetical protein